MTDRTKVLLLLAIQLIDAIGTQANDWDKLCDCNTAIGVHSQNCMTTKIRKDIDHFLDEVQK